MFAFSLFVHRLAARLAGALEARRRLEKRLKESERSASAADQRLSAVIAVSQKFVEASDEKEIVELVLRLSVELAGAQGASFVPLDDHGQPMAAINYGETPLPVPDAMLEYLASPAIREGCRVCAKPNHLTTTCPLISGPFAEATGVYCLSMRRGEREFGVLNIYLPSEDKLDAETRAFLQALVDETVLALEGVWLRHRELETLRQLQAIRQKTGLSSLLSGLLEKVYQTMEADFAVLLLKDTHPETAGAVSELVDDKPDSSARDRLVRGEIPAKASLVIEGVLQEVLASGDPLLLGNVTGDPAAEPSVRALMAAPVSVDDQPAMGVLLVGNRRSHTFNRRQLALVQTVAGQVSLVIQNNRHMADLEFRMVMEERTRLAREIHDGLAQTLGFLKLQLAQMQGYFERGESDRLQHSLRICYETLAEAYQDARYAIDGLRLSPCGDNLNEWLRQTLAEFQESMAPQPFSVKLACFDVHSQLPSEVQAQLVRIVQEALSNVRKHARAQNVVISCREQPGELVLEIQDDGVGFSAGDVPGPSRHGLRGMRERAELIKAEFQVISRPNQGTTVRLCLPTVMEEASP